jgi:hypothetical protein
VGLKICKYCLKSIEIEGDKNVFYTCKQCFNLYDINKVKACSPVVISVNELIRTIDKRLNHYALDTSKQKEYKKLQRKALEIKSYIHKKTSEGKL